MSTLKDPCKYSFKDLFIASNHPVERLSEFYKLSLKDRNIIVKEMCKTAGWVCEDVISEDQIFTAFSPSTNENNTSTIDQLPIMIPLYAFYTSKESLESWRR